MVSIQELTVNFFQEPKKEGIVTSAIDNILAVIFGVVLIGIYITFTNQGMLQEANTVLIFVILTVIVAIVGFVDELAERNRLKNPVAQTIKFGANPIIMILGFVIGAILALIITSFQNQSIISPLSVVLDNKFLQFLYVNLSAPYLEELFFRGLIIPTTIVISSTIYGFFLDSLNARFLGVLTGVIGGNLGFAFFHVSIFSPEQLLVSFAFGLMATLLVYGFKTLSAGVGFHFANNAVATGLI